MKKTEPDFFEMGRQDDEDTQKMAALPPRQNAPRAEPGAQAADSPANTLFQRSEEGPVTMSKEAPDEQVWPGQDAEPSRVSQPEPAPSAANISPEENTPEKPAKQIPADAARRSVIPPRRAIFATENRVQPVGKRNYWSLESAHKAEAEQLAISHSSLAQISEVPQTLVEPEAEVAEAVQQPVEESRAAADLPTNVRMPAFNLDVVANTLEASVSWQQTPQVLSTLNWQQAPEMPASWQAEQGTPTLAESEPVWGQTPAEEKPLAEDARERAETSSPEEEERRRRTAELATHKMAVLSTPELQRLSSLPKTPIPPTREDLGELPQTPVPVNLPRTPIPATVEDLGDLPEMPTVGVSEQPTTPMPPTPLPQTVLVRPQPARKIALTRGRAAFLIFLLAMLVVTVSVNSFSQFFGPRGWGSVFNTSSGGQSLLKQIKTPTPAAQGTATPVPLTPQQIVAQLLSKMTLDQKLGQMIMVRFNGSYYDPSTLGAMISQYHVGSVIEYNQNIINKAQLSQLNQQIQQAGDLPMIISTDQEGGTVDRMVNIDGPQPSASTIGASGNSQEAYQQGVKDGQDLSSCGINMNIAPVVDVGDPNVYNYQLSGRTFGDNPTTVTQMAGAYLEGLQQGDKVLGTLKHFPGGLAYTPADPHDNLPHVKRSLSDFNAIDWVPYKNLIDKGDVYSVMITHEIIPALDPNLPTSLSSKVVSILRNQLGFNGVIITDGLTMGGITNYYSLKDAARLAVEAGDDLLMDPASPAEVGQMIAGIEAGMSSGAITQQQIDASVTRILLLKYQLGLLNVNS